MTPIEAQLLKNQGTILGALGTIVKDKYFLEAINKSLKQNNYFVMDELLSKKESKEENCCEMPERENLKE